MLSAKPRQDLKIAILIPAYKRKEYTTQCVRQLEIAQQYSVGVEFCLVDDGSDDGTDKLFKASKLPATVIVNDSNQGLRNVLVMFIEQCLRHKFDYMGVIGNDCLVPMEWLNRIMDIFGKCEENIILSPNVLPSNAAYVHGKVVEGLPYMPAKTVGGLWFMPVSLANDVSFEALDMHGIKGAYHILQQIMLEKEPLVGWLPNITVQDMGHWSGKHPKHIKSVEHAEYYADVGRGVDW